jgi:hypothetical protein
MEAYRMSMPTHLVDLEKQHRALEAELAEAIAHPSTDDFTIAALKRRKLQLKDTIARLQHEACESVH